MKVKVQAKAGGYLLHTGASRRGGPDAPER